MLESPLEVITAVSLLGVSLKALHIWIVQYFTLIINTIIQALLYWWLVIARQPFSSLVIDFHANLSQNCNYAT
jgi:hypothetical protein